ncbi:MAG TPA: hypothetical protein VF527_11980 [Pyrinomonadaceae bacterium]|jgi:hypothetical protein
MNATTHAALHAAPAIPNSLRRSRLLSRGGFDVYEGLLDESFRKQLLAEALKHYVEALECDIPVSDKEEVRGGVPARRFLNAMGGPVQDAFYRAPWVLDFLRQLTAPSLVPTGVRGTYSYYVRTGDFLAIHRDIQTCDLAVITCLQDGAAVEGDGGSLCLYPERFLEPLSAVRSTPEEGALRLRLDVGQTIALCGGIVPHTLLPVAEGQERIVSVLCYHIP